MFLCGISILRTRKCRYLTILSFLLLWDISCCLCILSLVPPIPLKTLPFPAQIPPWVILLQISFVIPPVSPIDSRRIWGYSEPLKTPGPYTWKWILWSEGEKNLPKLILWLTHHNWSSGAQWSPCPLWCLITNSKGYYIKNESCAAMVFICLQ